MAQTATKIRADIAARSAPDDKNLLLWGLSCCSTSMEWQCLSQCRFVDGKRVYSPSTMLKSLSTGLPK